MTINKKNDLGKRLMVTRGKKKKKEREMRSEIKVRRNSGLGQPRTRLLF